MAYAALWSDVGPERQTNQDACCVKVATMPLGEILMALVCDGVGGLSAGELASSTVVRRFAQWFEEELPALSDEWALRGRADLAPVASLWDALLGRLNEELRAYGRHEGLSLGTTVSALLVCCGSYLVAHVGDCRVYRVGVSGVCQVTEDQTLLAKKLASGELSPEEAHDFPQSHVILQSVGTQDVLRPAFYRGGCTEADLFVLCCDGAYRKAGDRGIQELFGRIDRCDEPAMGRACRELVARDVSLGERDNLTVVCVSAALEGAHGGAAPLPVGSDGDDLPTEVRVARHDAPFEPGSVSAHRDDSCTAALGGVA